MKLWFFKRETPEQRRERQRYGGRRERFDTTQPPEDCNHVNVELFKGDTCNVLIGDTLYRLSVSPVNGNAVLHQHTVRVAPPPCEERLCFCCRR